jgi:hypothetical protein
MKLDKKTIENIKELIFKAFKESADNKIDFYSRLMDLIDIYDNESVENGRKRDYRSDYE